MRVTSSAVLNGRTMTVELDEQDVDPSGQLSAQSAQIKHQQMMMAADTMVVRYLLESEQISDEYAQQRLREINSRPSRIPVQ